MLIVERTVGNITILDVSGPLAEGDGDEVFRDAVNALVERGRTRVLLNLAEVPFLDSTGLGVLASKHVTLRRRDGQLKICNISARIRRVLETTKLLHVFEVFDSEAEAVRSFGPTS